VLVFEYEVFSTPESSSSQPTNKKKKHLYAYNLNEQNDLVIDFCFWRKKYEAKHDRKTDGNECRFAIIMAWI
jgi:hypothetical protein